MTRLLPCLALLALAVPAPAALADYRSGVEAWGRGDFAAAARDFRPAAEAGDAEAQYMMGRLYSLGDGVPRDFVRAWLWFDRAARQGHQDAAQARQGLDHVLNAGQLAEAHALARPMPMPVPAPEIAAAPPAIVTRDPSAARPVLLVPRQGAVAGADQQQAAR